MRDKRARAQQDAGSITDVERRAVEERLGFDTDSITAWARVLHEHLFAQPKDRRPRILAHAFTVFPYVRDVASDRFVASPLDGDTIERFERQHDPALQALVVTAREEHWEVRVFAERLLDLLTSLVEAGRIVLLGHAFWKYRITPYALRMIMHEHYEQTELPLVSAAAIAERAPELRARVIELRGILESLPCAPSWEGTLREFLAKFGRIEDPDIRAMVLAHCIGEFAEAIAVSQRTAMPRGIAIALTSALGQSILERLRALTANGERTDGEGGASADLDSIVSDLLERDPKAQA